MINFAIDGINLVIRGLNIINPGTDIPYLGKIGDSSSSSTYGPSDSQIAANRGGSSTSSSFTTSGSIPTSSTSAGSSATSGSKTAVAAAAARVASAYAAGSYFDPMSQKAPDYRSPTLSGSNINITVNGAMDPEAVSRQIVTLINESTARGTQGASNFTYSGGF
jgi:hypothetical protein